MDVEDLENRITTIEKKLQSKVWYKDIAILTAVFALILSTITTTFSYYSEFKTARQNEYKQFQAHLHELTTSAMNTYLTLESLGEEKQSAYLLFLDEHMIVLASKINEYLIKDYASATWTELSSAIDLSNSVRVHLSEKLIHSSLFKKFKQSEDPAITLDLILIELRMLIRSNPDAGVDMTMKYWKSNSHDLVDKFSVLMSASKWMIQTMKIDQCNSAFPLLKLAIGNTNKLDNHVIQAKISNEISLLLQDAKDNCR